MSQNPPETVVEVASHDLFAVDPFTTLPLRFVLTEQAICHARTMAEVRNQVESLTREALKRGLEVVRWDDPSTMEHVFEIRAANSVYSPTRNWLSNKV